MKTYTVEAVEPFSDQLIAERVWWFENREKNPFALDDEIDSLLDRLRTNPWSGQRVDRRPDTLRTMLLRTTQHRVAYRIFEADSVVQLLAIWGVKEGSPWF